MKTKTLLLTALFSLSFLASCTKISLEDLLTEMTDRTEMAKLSKHPYKLYQASSYDRASKSPKENWFANNDHTQFVREEKTDNGIEYVLMDAQAPGAITRFWTTFHATNFSMGTLRFYLDGAKEPQIEGRIDSLFINNQLFGKTLAFPAARFLEGGHWFHGSNIYAPIPFGKSCKITYQKRYPDAKDILYYNINYRLYEAGTRVETLPHQAEKNPVIKQLYADASERLNNKAAPQGEQIKRTNQTLAAGAELSIPLKGSKYIQQIQLKLNAENLYQALRQTVIALNFDGKPKAWVPVGEFFGTSYLINPSENWVTKVSKDGSMQIDLPMPFQQQADIKLINYGSQEVQIEKLTLSVADWKWDSRSLYFNANWQLRAGIPTNEKQDLNYNTIQGKGKYVGDVLSLYNRAEQWWGEGDEKIYVDGEAFPSHFGTGTEDYFGYAWCSNVNFQSPFIAQPKGDGNRNVGMSINARWRMLDALPFTESLRFDMELWHWRQCKMDYATTSYWYGTEDTKSSVQVDEQSVQVPLSFSNEYQVDNFQVAQKNGGIASSESYVLPGWFVRFAKLWNGIQVGDELTLSFDAHHSQKGKMHAGFKLQPNSVVVDIYLNEQLAYENLNLVKADGAAVENIASKESVNLQQGENTLRIVVKELAKNKEFGAMVFDSFYLE